MGHFHIIATSFPSCLATYFGDLLFLFVASASRSSWQIDFSSHTTKWQLYIVFDIAGRYWFYNWISLAIQPASWFSIRGEQLKIRIFLRQTSKTEKPEAVKEWGLAADFSTNRCGLRDDHRGSKNILICIWLLIESMQWNDVTNVFCTNMHSDCWKYY